MPHILAFQIPSMGEWVVIAAIGLLFFGKRLPETAKNLAQAIGSFKKGLKESVDGVETSDDAPVTRPVIATDYRFDPYTGKALQAPAHQFDPHTGQPLVHSTDPHALPAPAGAQ